MNHIRNFSVYLTYFLSTLLGCDMTCDFAFNRDLIAVYYNPYVNHKSERLRAYTEADLIPMINKISTRFSKIEMPSVYDHHLEELDGKLASIIHIPNAIANLNKNSTLLTQQSARSTPKIIHLTTTFHLESNYRDSTFDSVKNLSDSSNLIFPGTIQNISLWCPVITAINFKKIERHLKYAKNDISRNSSFQYQLGTNIDISVCNQSIYFERLLQLLDYVYFDILNKQENLQDDMESTVEIYIKQMETCKEKMKRLQPNLHVGFRLSWQDTDINGKQNISNLVYFWEQMSYFASSTSTNVILSEAFDVPYYQRPYNSQGWWRLHKNTTYNNSGEYVFEEKCSLVSNVTIKKNLYPNIQTSNSKTNNVENMTNLAYESSKGHHQHESYWVIVSISGIGVAVIYGIFVTYKLFIKSFLNRRLIEHEDTVNFARDQESM